MPSRRSASTTVTPKTATANGTAEHADPELHALEPMDRMPECGAMAAWGVRCTNDAYHPGAHSWGGEQEQLKPDHTKSCAFILSDAGDECDCGASDGRPSGSIEHGAELLRAEADARQTTLPGTPEATQTALIDQIPYESSFNNADYQDAALVREIAEFFIAETSEFAHLRGIDIRYLWKRRGGLKGGQPNLGQLQKPGGLAAFGLGRPQFVLWVASDHCREAKLTDKQMQALIFDRLCRGAVDPDDHSAFRVTGPDFEGNILTIQRWGFWHPDLRELGANVKQLGLLDTITDQDVEALDDADDAVSDDAEADE